MAMTDMAAAPSIADLKRVQALSRPIYWLLSLALGLLLFVQIPLILAILFLFYGGEWRAWATFSETGLGLSIVRGADAAPGVALETLDFWKRSGLALLAAACAGCSALMLFHLRQLFGLFTRGAVFAKANTRHLQRFALWLAAAAIVANVSSRLFEAITDVPPSGVANAVLAVVIGAMIYVVARVMELATEADEERKDFI
jgi:hypothetical protein